MRTAAYAIRALKVKITARSNISVSYCGWRSIHIDVRAQKYHAIKLVFLYVYGHVKLIASFRIGCFPTDTL